MTSQSGKTLSVVGGIVFPRRRIPLSKGMISWPFARLTLTADEAIFAARGVLKHVVRPITIPYRDLIEVERVVPPKVLHFGEGLRFRSRSKKWPELYFETWRQRAHELVRALRDSGVEIR